MGLLDLASGNSFWKGYDYYIRIRVGDLKAAHFSGAQKPSSAFVHDFALYDYVSR